jgi:hypothetical protein
MANCFHHKRKIAVTMLLIWGGFLLLPFCTYALTSGPAQPEVQGFQVATVSDMVDLSSGSMKYNIPLLDIDGYPINLSYQSGAGIDDEASWVGSGWILNPGAINRQVRGLPDDFSGDTVETDHYTKPKVTVGGRLTAKVEYSGIAILSGSFTFGLFNDNYTGLGAELGVNAGISVSTPGDGSLTAGLGAGILSSTQSGVDAELSPYVSLAVKGVGDQHITVNAGLSGSFGYNTRSGTKALTLGESFGASAQSKDKVANGDNAAESVSQGSGSYDVAGSTITYNTEPISPTITIPYISTFGSFSFNLGGAVFGLFGSIGGTGYQNVRKVQNMFIRKPAYGFLYAERGANNKDAVMDFFREQDNPVIPALPDLAIPVHTPDIWSFTSQAGSGQFRLYRGGSGAFFDNQEIDKTGTLTIGADYGFGTWFHGGVTYYGQSGKTTTQKWTNSNAYLPNGDFQQPNYNNPNAEHAYFRVVGEKNIEDQDMDRLLAGTQPLEVKIQGMSATNYLRNTGNLYGPGALHVDSPIAKTSRRPNSTVISYLTAVEASQAALYKHICSYPEVDTTSIPYLVSAPVPDSTFDRVDTVPPGTLCVHQPHHISEITVTDPSGKRMVYGIPVYNTSQDEYSFAIDPSTRDANNLVTVPTGITSPDGDPYGVDNYYHKEHKPPYATSYLLTAILSPDYVDKTGNGITDDDQGTAIKFNYSKLPYYYKWRTPYTRATPNRCLLADQDDDKGSIVYGQKEIWYVQSIESKTKIAYFLTADRRDAAGVSGWQNGGIDTTNTQRCLMQIRLYSKADMSKPIKVVKFQYNYSLCPGVPNSLDAGTGDPTLGGKLTLTNVWFEYGNASKGKYHPYSFQYNTTIAGGTATPTYGYQHTDRWGIYKDPSENANSLDNEQYPYADQDKNVRDSTSALWQLSQIRLPTGGIINVSYESGDYAYVQNQQAMAMTPIVSLLHATGDITDTTRALNKNIGGIRVNTGTDSLPPPHIDTTKWFENTFLNGSTYLYTKMYVNMTTNNYPIPNPLPYDAVPTYCQISKVSVRAGQADIMFTPVDADNVTTNPISICAWQRMKNEYPRYAYPGFDSRVQSQNNSVLAAVSAIVSAARNVSELREGFYQKASKRGYASQVIIGQSYAKLGVLSGFKLGGTVRVKKIQINDNWQAMTNPKSQPASYGQAYTYTTTANGQTISSGVAAYEPSVGNDENALKQPVPYIQNIKGAINNYFDLEKPFGESFFPAPTICYSKVTVNDLDQTHNASTLTGSVVNEFYTCKDYPTVVTPLPLISSPYRPTSYYSLTRSNSDDELCLSQGYSITVNDMQGKTKATTVFDQSGAVISKTQYYYSSQNNGGVQTLNNSLNVINPVTLQMSPKILGQDVDFFTDFREQESKNTGLAINLGADVFPIPPFIAFFILPHFPIHENDDYKLFRSACAVKVIQQYGIMNKVVKTENGSTITTEDIAFDQLTGEPLVTKTQNEFNKPIYSVNIPAYWVYTGMGAAYQNLGIVLSGFTTNSSGEIITYNSYLQAGDQVLDKTTGNQYWVINNQAVSGSGNTLKLIDRNGNLQLSYTASFVKLIRSGYRNMLSANTSTLVMLNNPITADNHLNLLSSSDLTALKVINASATTYDQSWASGAPQQVINVNQSYPFNLRPGDFADTYGKDFGKVQVDSLSSPVISRSWAWSIALTRCSVWIGGGDSSSVRTWNGLQTCITAPVSKTYYMGYAGDNIVKVYVDSTFRDSTVDDTTSYFFWHIMPLYLTAGKHTIQVSFLNKGGPAAAGFELYNNSGAALASDTIQTKDLNMLFSTQQVINATNVQTYRTVDGTQLFQYTVNGVPLQVCNTCGTPAAVNPYIQGYLGNWRPYQTKVFQKNRSYAFASNLNSPAVRASNAGYLQNFYPYWYSNGTSWLLNPNGTSWVTANTVTLYDQYGQQLENVDALGRFSAATFDFNGELPASVASNAMNREIYAASLEDCKFVPGGNTATDTCNTGEFRQPSTNLSIKQLAVNTISHSGNYSALLPADGLTMGTIIDTVHQKTTAYLGTSSSREYIPISTTGLYPIGFAPYPGKKYMFDAWVKDGLPNDKSVNITLNINGNAVPLKCRAVVEGWKLLEGTMDLSTLGGATALDISILPGSGQTIYIDDIRMYPFAALMKTYAYDDQTMRLMAELDENGFATFYEYDDEGLLVRVKKETEKGIMTLKESRSTYRRTP